MKSTNLVSIAVLSHAFQVTRQPVGGSWSAALDPQLEAAPGAKDDPFVLPGIRSLLELLPKRYVGGCPLYAAYDDRITRDDLAKLVQGVIGVFHEQEQRALGILV